jgi:hypothetical protein
VPENEIPELKERLKEEHNAIPIMLDDELADRHYNGFSSELARRHCTLFASTNCLYRLHPLASFPLPSRRDYLRRVGMGRLQGGKQTVCKGRRS